MSWNQCKVKFRHRFIIKQRWCAGGIKYNCHRVRHVLTWFVTTYPRSRRRKHPSSRVHLCVCPNKCDDSFQRCHILFPEPHQGDAIAHNNSYTGCCCFHSVRVVGAVGQVFFGGFFLAPLADISVYFKCEFVQVKFDVLRDFYGWKCV